jgi:2-haloacid dehalogenase
VFDPAEVTTVTFDSYGTLVNVDDAERALADHVETPESISRLWRTRSLEYAFLAGQIDAYEPFYELNRYALQYALDSHGVDLSSDERDEILSVYHELDVYDDVRPGMERLHDAGYDLYVLSNGNPEMLDSLVDHADIEDLIEDTISADEIRQFKPAADLYRHAAGRTGTPIDRIAHVAGGQFDVMGAGHAGMRTVWVNRDDSPPEPFGDGPDETVADIEAAAAKLTD